ncbi:GNAT family N-acetyltransferase [Thiohalophilus sp.]|uniref:GNAT family N-acetyltransferase n=1 Tax=Thiohalophilus sp. TaxID=3028392 RepID=UPI002ACD8E8A|nr:GNAT family N-acetyltransferase [Thiohalophilus sp.]MDZ7804398.1 GNAT family N-acetyltransferase [Thiohalophilus sp.]
MLTKEYVLGIKLEKNDRLEIEILDFDLNNIGFLSLIVEGDNKDNKVVESLTRWRNKFMRFFLTQFNATTERTSYWLESVVIPSPSNLLFMILDGERNLVGNFGVANITNEKCELDNLIRGEKGAPKLIYFSEIALLNWLFEHGVKKVNLHVFANNTPTIKLHKSVGFTECNRITLYEESLDTGDINYTSESASDEIVGREYIEMVIDYAAFNKSYGSRNIER